MEQLIRISTLNDFIFCPASIYYHGMYEDLERSIFQEIDQIRGTATHKSIDSSTYTTRKDILQAVDVYCEKYNLIGKIDLYDEKKKFLIERKHHVAKIYDGYVFQLYAQYFSLIEQGYEVKKLKIYSYADNKSYEIKKPDKDELMLQKFEALIQEISDFKIGGFRQSNEEKCKRCIYAPLCVNGGERIC